MIDITTAIFESSVLDFGDGLKLDVRQDVARVDRNRPMECPFGIVDFESASLPV